jgi:hypothetical protein
MWPRASRGAVHGCGSLDRIGSQFRILPIVHWWSEGARVNAASHPEAMTARRSATREPTSRVDQLARTLRRVALLLTLAFLVAAVTAIIWVDNEITDPPLWRYITAVADEGIFLVGAVIAWVGSAIVEALGRVRASLLDAMNEQSTPTARRGFPVDEWQ